MTTIDPVQGEFFTDRDISDRLVRETLQNSLDEPASDEKVRVRFALSSSDLAPSKAKAYLSGLSGHVAASQGNQGELAALASGTEPMPFLVIEDFGTKGLVGDVGLVEIWEDQSAKDNNFYWFFRNVGRSGKTAQQAGSWGLGKWVFPDASKINTFFALTVRSDDKRELLMGQSILKIHSLAENGEPTRYPPYGFFAQIASDGFQLPIEDPDYINAFRSAFSLTRTNEPGLSIVVPFPSSEISAMELLRSVVQYYFYPILSDELVVEIEDQDAAWVVDVDSIFDLVSEISWSEGGTSADDMKSLFDLVQEQRTLPDDQFIEASVQGAGTPSWQERFDEEVLDDLRKRYLGGDRLSFRIPIRVRRKNQAANTSAFDIVLQRDAEISDTKDVYVRRNLTIPDVSRGLSYPVRAFVHVADTPLNELMRDSEEPSHSNWKPLAQKVRDGYAYGPDTVRFVARCLTGLIRLLTQAGEEKHEDLLQKFFSVGIRSPATNTPGPVPPPEPSPAIIERLTGGFRVKPNLANYVPGDQIRIRVAYNIRRGNPLARYHPFDFDLAQDEITVTTNGGGVELVASNELVFQPNDTEGLLEVAGFDARRDLYVHAVRESTP